MTLYFHRDTGVIDPAIYASTAVYRREQHGIFVQSWLAIGPADWLRRPGAFLTATMGEVPVIAWCDDRGAVRVFLNQCHSGMGVLSDAERGVAPVLACSCHRRAYAPQPSPCAALPLAVPRVAILTGLVFACFDAEAADLVDVLGDLAEYWQAIEAQFGGVEIHGQAALRSWFDANWKLPVETYAGDMYRELTLLQSTRALVRDAQVEDGFQVSAGNGAMVMAARDDLVPVMGSMFPNLSYDGRAGAFHIWQPRGPLACEVRSYCVVGRDATPEERLQRQRRFQLLCGPAGFESGAQDRVWASMMQAGNRPGRTMTLQAGLGQERRTNRPGLIGPLNSECNQRAFYGWWQDRLEPDDRDIHASY